jgi:hypothetical protein
VTRVRPYGQRDENGWRIPRAGTLSRRIYCLMRAGTLTDLAANLASREGIRPTQVYMLAWKIRNPDRSNNYMRRLRAGAEAHP